MASAWLGRLAEDACQRDPRTIEMLAQVRVAAMIAKEMIEKANQSERPVATDLST